MIKAERNDLIIEWYRQGEKQSAIAARVGLTQCGVSLILRKRGVGAKLVSCVHCAKPLAGNRRADAKYCDLKCRNDARNAGLDPVLRGQARLKRYYGITVAQRDALIAAQGGCAICGVRDPGSKGWMVDHDHSCCPGERTCGNCVRGVLCARCNVAIGQFDDDPERLRRAAAYVEGRFDERHADRNHPGVGGLSRPQ